MSKRKTTPSRVKRAASSQIWGGRFAGGPAAIMQAINASIDVDRALYAQDIAGSKAHARMLVDAGILSAKDGAAIAKGLDAVLAEIEAGRFVFRHDLEDIHMNIEVRLGELIGEAAKRLHTARSRNDQVATDFKLWVRAALDRADAGAKDLQRALVDRAAEHKGTIMPGYTHLQSAQPVTFGHHCLAYVEMLERDRGRFADARKRLNECPLGSGALAGTAFAIDRDATAKALGFDRPTANSLDSVADRDFALEALNAAAITVLHLSRLAEELVLWCSPGFGFIALSDAFTTGSSMMPQKRNPDAAELVRAKTGRIFAAQLALQTVMKGLPLAYSKDMQEDKELTFDAFKALDLALAAMAGMVRDLKVNAGAMSAAAARGHSTATDLADWLVRVLNKPFREAHHITGKLVALADKKGCGLADLSLRDMQKIEPKINNDVYLVLSVESSVKSRKSFGGTAPGNVAKQVARWRKTLS